MLTAFRDNIELALGTYSIATPWSIQNAIELILQSIEDIFRFPI